MMKKMKISHVDASTPWTHISDSGGELTVDVFVTTLLSQVSNALRRTITVPYTSHFGLTVSEWRLLALIAHARRLAFSELVLMSTSDKALVSRTLKLLQGRKLISLHGEGNTPRKKIFCEITEEGRALHAQVMPLAQAGQAQALLVLAEEERDVFFRALHRLREYGLEKNPQEDF